MVNVLCLKWGTKYSPEYVNKLYGMVSRNLSIPFRFICITEDPTGIRPEVEIRPLLVDDQTGWWHKVSFFKSPLHDIEGTVLTLDLDIVIVDNIDCFFEQEGEFCIVQDYFPQNLFNSSVMRFEANGHSDIWNNFNYQNLQRNPRKYWGDQIWISECRPGATVWPTDWVKSYKYECVQDQSFVVPPDCKIVLFHGKPDPHERLDHVGKYWLD